MMRAFALLWVLTALAGCAADAPAQEPEGPPVATIAGYVMDAALRPVEGAVVVLGGAGLSDRTDSDGFFEIVTEGAQEVYGLRVTAPGFIARSVALQSAEASPVFDERIVLERIPEQTPYHDTLPFRGNIACSFFAQAQHSHGGPGDPGAHNSNDCSQGTNDEVWTFPVGPGVRNVVIEVFWEPNSVLSERMALFVEGPNVGPEGDVLFYFNEGPSGVRATISKLQASTYYQGEGGEVRVTVKIGAPEEDVAAGAAVNQPFEVFATAFYVLPGPSDFSVVAS